MLLLLPWRRRLLPGYAATPAPLLKPTWPRKTQTFPIRRTQRSLAPRNLQGSPSEASTWTPNQHREPNRVFPALYVASTISPIPRWIRYQYHRSNHSVTTRHPSVTELWSLTSFYYLFSFCLTNRISGKIKFVIYFFYSFLFLTLIWLYDLKLTW